MRMRRKPWARPELAECKFFIDEPITMKGKWAKSYKVEQPLHLELGCGKGTFMAEIAFRNPNINYIAIDIKSEVLAVGRRNIVKKFDEDNRDVENILMMSWDIERLDQIFGQDDKIDRIYINFCNPWSREKHKKRRLTHTRQLELYKKILSQNGEIRFKTDDEELYRDSLIYFKESNLEITFSTEDLHALNLSDNIITEHEQMFTDMGKKIYACNVVYKG